MSRNSGHGWRPGHGRSDRIPTAGADWEPRGGGGKMKEGQAMATKTPRHERGRRTLRKRLEAAAQECATRGYHDAAITGITARAGVALGSFYTYFESKEEVFRALVKVMSQAVRSHVAEAVKDAPDRLTAERTGLAA